MSKLKNLVEVLTIMACNGIQARLRLLLQIFPLLDIRATYFITKKGY